MAFPEDQPQLASNGITAAENDQIVGTNIGEVINKRYIILSPLGKGGMGVAYKALDQQLKQLVVLKFLLPHRFSNTRDISRFEREAKTASVLSHPGIVKVIDFAILANQQPYLVMEFLDGHTLAHRIETEGQLATEETIDLFIQICDALIYAHSKGILHRDIKPSNIIVTTSDGVVQAKLLDFGLAKIIDDIETTTQHITQTNELVGSAFYMSPEQARNARLDARSDLYSVGCSIYEALTGGPPHLGATSIATLLKRETDPPLPLSEASFGKRFSDPLEHLVAKLLKTSPDERYQSAEELKRELVRIKSLGFVASKSVPQKPPPITKPFAVKPPYVSITIAFACLIALCLIAKSSLMLGVPQSTAPGIKVVESPTSGSMTEEGMLALQKRWEPAEFNRIGDEYMKKRQFAEALINYKKCVALCDGSPFYPKDKYAFAVTNLAYCNQLLGNYKEADEAIKRASKLYEELYGKRSQELSFTLTAMGCTLLKQDSVTVQRAFKTAGPLFQRSISIQTELPDKDGTQLPIRLAEQGTACVVRGLFGEARWRLEQSVALFHKAPGIAHDPYYLEQTLVGLANMYRLKGDFSKVPPLCHEIATRFGDMPTVNKGIIAPFLVGVGDIVRLHAYNTSDPVNCFRQAQLAYEAALPVYLQDPTSHPKELAELYDNLSTVCKKQSKSDKPNSSENQMAIHWTNEANSIRRNMLKAN